MTATAEKTTTAAVMREGLTRASRVTVVIALGTHQGMSTEQLGRHLGYAPGTLEQAFPGWDVRNHEFWQPGTFTTVGAISADRIAELTGGLLSDTAVDVRINRHVAEADVAIVVGPVFPHEVVGFSGGNKYFFPGVSGPELINLSHWVGVLITGAEMIGTRGVTPVRADRRSGESDSGEATGLLPGGCLWDRRLACGGFWYAGRYEADPDTFVEPHAGEVLYRLRPGSKGVPAGEPDGRLPSAEGLDG